MVRSYWASGGCFYRNLVETLLIILYSLAIDAATAHAWVSITYPPDDATLSGIVTVKATVENDTTSQLLIDNVPEGAATSGTVSFTWDTSTALEGAHWLTVQALKAGTSVADSTQSIMVSVLNVQTVDQKLRFNVLPSSSPLPSGPWCAHAIPWESEPVSSNSTPNHTMATSSQLQSYAENGYAYNVYDGKWAYSRVAGQYAATTDMINRWAACKWGIDEDVVRAQAWIESDKWSQGTHGDKRYSYDQCVQSGFSSLWDFQCSNCCYQSWSMWQTKVYYEWATWPMMQTSTAFAGDYRYANQRMCMNGDLKDYFADQPIYNGHSYALDIESGDIWAILWGCIGYHYSGRWYDGDSTQGAVFYINKVQSAFLNKPWKTQWPSINWPD